VTVTRLWTPDVMEALWRDPGALGAGQVWRLLTPQLKKLLMELNRVVTGETGR